MPRHAVWSLCARSRGSRRAKRSHSRRRQRAYCRASVSRVGPSRRAAGGGKLEDVYRVALQPRSISEVRPAPSAVPLNFITAVVSSLSGRLPQQGASRCPPPMSTAALVITEQTRTSTTGHACAEGFGSGEDIEIHIRPRGISRQGGWRGHHHQVQEGSSRLHSGRSRGFRLLHSRRQGQEIAVLSGQGKEAVVAFLKAGVADKMLK
jgi:hypothetical protein